jgi:hypothetical protein
VAQDVGPELKPQYWKKRRTMEEGRASGRGKCLWGENKIEVHCLHVWQGHDETIVKNLQEKEKKRVLEKGG